jgi:glycosyltransferase A (GT-A) superfamily protein (DUF2064 family)
MAHAPEVGGVRPELESLLGTDRAAALERTLIQRAVAWAAEVAPGRVHVAYEPADAEPSLRSLVGAGVGLFAQRGDGASRRLRDAAGRLFAAGHGPVLVAWPELACWRREHAGAALDDLGAGCDVSVGPVFDGGFYLLGLGRLVPSLFELPEAAWHSPDVMGLTLTAIHEAGLEAGLVRAERGLRRPADVRAALADPLLDAELASILRG